ncbi:MAG: hypothetical protein OSB09_09985 [Planctomycetota bacterium]|nr:hypothetical protein [Planctomycetota bacterium]
MNKSEQEKISDSDLDGVAGGGGKLSAHDLKKLSLSKPNLGNSPTPVPDPVKDPPKKKPQGK